MSEQASVFPGSRSKIETGIIRMGIYLMGIVVVALGIVLCVKSRLGISPISSIPYVLQLGVPLSFGTLTMLFHLTNSLIQYVLERKLLNVRIFLQIPVAVLFGVVIDFLQKIVRIDSTKVLFQWMALVFSVFFTALGMVLMINMNLVQNPPDGTVRLLSHILKIEMGKVKITYDIICVITSLILCFVLFRRLEGFGIATIISAIFVGRTLSFLQGNVGKFLRSRID